MSTICDTSENNSTNIDPEQNQNFTYVTRNIISKRKITLEFAANSIASEENVDAQEKLQQLKLLKECCRNTFKNEVEAYMLDEIQNQVLGFLPCNVGIVPKIVIVL